ncbi:MAG: hypothetical protein ABSG46_05795 [Candidatus Binataceae bacterium]|jgi:hypothetical protein
MNQNRLNRKSVRLKRIGSLAPMLAALMLATGVGNPSYGAATSSQAAAAPSGGSAAPRPVKALPAVAAHPDKTFPNVEISAEPAIVAGDTVAAYITVRNTSTNSNPLSTSLIVLNWPRAITSSGQKVNRLDAPTAIARAGGSDQLLAALGERGSELRIPTKSRIAGDIMAAPIIPILAPGLLVAGPAALIYRSMEGHEYRQRLKIDAKEFQLSPTRLDPFGTRLLTFAEPPIDGLLPGWSETGYVFYPRGDYVALEVTAQEYQGSITEGAGVSETVTCPWE